MSRERAEQEERLEYETSTFGQFMSQSEEERWRTVFDRLQAIEDAAS